MNYNDLVEHVKSPWELFVANDLRIAAILFGIAVIVTIVLLLIKTHVAKIFFSIVITLISIYVMVVMMCCFYSAVNNKAAKIAPEANAVAIQTQIKKTYGIHFSYNQVVHLNMYHDPNGGGFVSADGMNFVGMKDPKTVDTGHTINIVSHNLKTTSYKLKCYGRTKCFLMKKISPAPLSQKSPQGFVFVKPVK